MSKTIIITVLVICVALSAFFSCTEMAFAKVNKTRLSRDAENKVKSAILANTFVNDYNDTITIILIGNNLVNILASSFATILFTSYFPKNGELIATVVMTLIILTFGEIIPKIFMPRFSTKLSIMFVNPILFFSFIFTKYGFYVIISM